MNDARHFFHVSGPLGLDAPSYIERPADHALLAALEQHELCLVLAPRQTGKSSLMVRTIGHLRQHGAHAGIVDLQRLTGQRDRERWFGAVVNQITRSLRLSIDATAWWQSHGQLDAAERFVNFLEDVLLAECDGDVVLFVDEVDSALPLAFSDDFFTTIRSIYNNRAVNPALNCLTFVLLGVTTASAFIRDRSRTPFNIGRSIALDDFDRHASAPFENVFGAGSEALVERIFYWTHGQPFLVQKLAETAYSWPPDKRCAEQVDKDVEAASIDSLSDRVIWLTTAPNQRSRSF